MRIDDKFALLLLLAMCISVSWSSASSEKVTDLRNRLQNLTQHLNDSVGDRPCDRMRDSINQLSIFDALLEAFRNFLLIFRQRFQNVVNTQTQDILQEMNNWMSSQVERFAERTGGVGIEKAISILSDFRNRYSSFLSSCMSEVDYEVLAYEKLVDEFLNYTLVIIQDFGTRFRFCQENCESKACHENITSILADLTGVRINVTNLNSQGDQLITVGLNISNCVQQTLADYYLERETIKLQLNSIAA